MNSAFVSPTRVYSASTSEARGFALERSGFPTRAMFAWFVVLKNSTPLSASNAPPPQFAPPMMPGRCTVPRRLGGVNSGPMRYFCSSCLRRRLQLRREIERVVQRHALLGEGRRLGRQRLRRPGVLAGDVARRHRPLLDRPHRLAGDAIEDEREALLGELDDGVDRAGRRQ